MTSASTFPSVSQHPLAQQFERVARDELGPAGLGIEVVGSPPGPADVIAAFTRHVMIATGIKSGAIHDALGGNDIAAPLAPPFVQWLAERLGTTPGMLDLVLVHSGERRTTATRSLHLIDMATHPRIGRANRYRQQVSVYTDDQDRGLVVLGKGLANRWEMGVEIDPEHRGMGLGREMIGAGLAEVPVGEPVFAQIPPGNAASVRTFLAAGFRPIGAEILFLRP